MYSVILPWGRVGNLQLLQPLRWRCFSCAIHHEQCTQRVIPMEWSWWVTSHNACDASEQLIVLANGDDESDLVGWSLLLLVTTVWSFAHMPLGLSNRNTARVLHLARQAIFNGTQKLQVLHINFVMIHNKCYWPSLVQKDRCSWHIEWFGNLNRHVFAKRLSTPGLVASASASVYH